MNLPAAVLSQSRVEHNLAWMQRFVSEYGAKLAPHGKTTMAPRLFQRQLAGGAWGITLATAHQTRIAYAHGVRRVMMANQLVGKRNMAILAELLADPPGPGAAFGSVRPRLCRTGSRNAAVPLSR